MYIHKLQFNHNQGQSSGYIVQLIYFYSNIFQLFLATIREFSSIKQIC